VSQENVEIVRAAFDAFSLDDIEGVLRLCHEDIVITQPPELPDAAPQQRGHSGVLEAFAIWPEQWDDYHIDVLQMADHGDRILVTTRQRGRGKQSGIQVEMDIMFVFTVQNEKIMEMKIFMREDQALEAAGLRE
jgi:ketosteroid isomerase-like protein